MSQGRHYSLPWEGVLAAIRGTAFAAAFIRRRDAIRGGFRNAAYGGTDRGVLSKDAAGVDYTATGRPRMTRRQFWRTLERAAGYVVAALFCSALVHHGN